MIRGRGGGGDRAAGSAASLPDLPDGTGAGAVTILCKACSGSGIGAGWRRPVKRRAGRIGPKEDGSLWSRGAGADSSEENRGCLGFNVHLGNRITMITSVSCLTNVIITRLITIRTGVVIRIRRGVPYTFQVIIIITKQMSQDQ